MADRRTISAFLVGMENRLRAADALNDLPGQSVGKACGVQVDGKPPNNCGQWYYAVHLNGLSSDDQGSDSNDSLLAATVTITRRAGQFCKDRKGRMSVTANEIYDQADWVKDLFHQDDATRILANIEMGMTATEAANARSTMNGFVEPLKYRSVSNIQEWNASWVGGDPDSANPEKDIFVVAVEFNGARLVKPIGG